MNTIDTDIPVVDPQDLHAPPGPDSAFSVKNRNGRPVRRFSKRGAMVIYAVFGIIIVAFAYGIGTSSKVKTNDLPLQPPLQQQAHENPAILAGQNGDALEDHDALADLTSEATPPPVAIEQTSAPSLKTSGYLHQNFGGHLPTALVTDAPRPTITFDTSGGSVPPPPVNDGSGLTVPNAGGGGNPGAPAALASHVDAEQAHHSGLFVTAATNATAVSPPPITTNDAPAAPVVNPNAPLVVPADETPATVGAVDPQQQKVNFASQNGGLSKDVYLPNVRTPALGEFELWAGATIPGELDTGINTDLPGVVTAHVRNDVYDSRTGKTLVVPHGSRLIGHVNSIVSTGQSRVQVSWDRLYFPDGSYLMLNGQEGADQQGNSGLFGDVNDHQGSVLGATILTGLLAAAGTLIAPNSYSSTTTSNGQVVYQNVGQTITQTGQQVIAKKLNQLPTITVPKGENFEVVLDRTVLLRPEKGGD